MNESEQLEPEEETLPDKPVIEDMPDDLDEDKIEEPGDEEVPEEEVLPPESAAMDDTIDDEEEDVEPEKA
jgi:hypothetical protein